MTESAEQPFDVTSEFAALREKRVEDLTNAFVNGGVMLAKQRDPVRQFETFIKSRFAINESKRQEAQRQFAEMVQKGGVDVSRMFDLYAAALIFRIDPLKFYRTLDEALLAKERDALWNYRTKEKFNSLIPKKLPFTFQDRFLKYEPWDFKKIERNENKDKILGELLKNSIYRDLWLKNKPLTNPEKNHPTSSPEPLSPKV